MKHDDYVPLLNLTRGEVIESCHFGAFVVADREGKIIASEGNPGTRTFPRSSMKPLQSLAFLENGGDQYWGLTPKEIAITCASHSGTDQHVEVLKNLHSRIGISVNDLKCGVHWPMDKATAEAMKAKNEVPDAYRHNCSGKHTGMLAFAKMQGLPLEDYLELDHPVQQTIRQVVAEMCDLDPSGIQPGLDGCSAPVYALPLQNFAMAIARLCDPEGLNPQRASASQRIFSAMALHPEMVAGPGRFDTILMQAMNGKLIAKGGAEGYQCMGIKPGALGKGSPALGIALKISDGDHAKRAISSVSLAILEKLGLMDVKVSSAMQEFSMQKIYNWRHLEVGVMQPAFSMDQVSWQ